MSETQQSIYKWQCETFGYPRDVEDVIDKLYEEVLEVEDTLLHRNQDFIPEILEEVADVIIVASGLAEHLDIDLQKVVEDKMLVNRTRKWMTDGLGTGKHKDD